MKNLQTKFSDFVSDDYSMEICDYVPESQIDLKKPRVNDGHDHSFRSYGKNISNSLILGKNLPKHWFSQTFHFEELVVKRAKDCDFKDLNNYIKHRNQEISKYFIESDFGVSVMRFMTFYWNSLIHYFNRLSEIQVCT